MNAKQMCGAIVALCVAVVAARADSLELKNGSLIKGRFMGGTQTGISFQVGSSVQSYDVAEVRSLRFESGSAGCLDPRFPRSSRVCRSSIEQNEVAKTSSSVTIPAGTRISVRTIDSIDSTRNRVGYRFQASLEEPLSVDGKCRGSEGRRRLRPAGRIQRDRNFHWKVRTKTRADGNRGPWPDCAASHRRIRSLRQVQGREYCEKNSGGSRHWEHHRCACRRREGSGHRGRNRGGRGSCLGNYHQGRPSEDPERDLTGFHSATERDDSETCGLIALPQN